MQWTNLTLTTDKLEVFAEVEPKINYHVSVLAFTSVGGGPTTNQTFRTVILSRLCQKMLQVICHFVCLNVKIVKIKERSGELLS